MLLGQAGLASGDEPLYPPDGSMTESHLPSPYPAAGEIVDGKYKIEKLLGEGGMGAVARATHVVLGGTLALKFMNPQFMTFPGAVERFVNEGRASKAIKSDHVLPVTDVGLLPNGTPYLLMECLYGLDLADLLARDGPSGLPIERAVHFTLQILRGLQAAHAIGIIHRDMKPSNCFVVTHDGEEDFVKILDFGISKVVQPGSSSLTQTNSALGTPLYMSPEQARSPRDVDMRSDLYSVGVILYELLSGRTPFFSESGEFTEILFQLFTADPPPIQQTRPDLPDALAAIVHKALAREVNERYSTALEMAEALVAFANDRSLGLVERMRGFKPPTKESIIPGIEGLPTSMAAFSQLQRGHGTDVMVNRPTTDVQKGAPVTEVLIDGSPKAATPIQARTEVMKVDGKMPGPAHVAAVPELFAMRARPDEALGRTQLELDPKRLRSERPANANKPITAAQTDLGAARDATAVEQGTAPPGRSPFVYALPVVAILALAAGVGVVITRSGSDPKTVATSEPPPPVSMVASAAPPPSISPSVSAPALSVSAPAPPVSAASAKPTTSATTTPTAAKPPTKPNPPGYIPGLDTNIRN
ncbi:MAG: Serine/threonine protein kinase PrkC, regulator of stationary phase [Labilithrix sp.]|nr:Serine/threonine protein kinase PrkC, regulator of stationary phase [Labilithrix sp.]